MVGYDAYLNAPFIFFNREDFVIMGDLWQNHTPTTFYYAR